MKSAFLISFLDIFSSALLIAVAPIQLLILGGSRFQIGLLVSLHALLQLLTGPLVSSLSEKTGRKRALLRIGVLSLISNALLFITGSLNVYIGSRLLSSLFGHTQLLVKAIIGENVPLEKHREVFTKLGGLAGLSFVLGPLVGGYLHSMPGGFYYIAVTLTTINALILALSVTLSSGKPASGKPKSQDETSKGKTKKNKKLVKKTDAPVKEDNQLFRAFKNMTKVNWKLYWDVLTFKFLNETSNWIFACSIGALIMMEFRASQIELSGVVSLLSFMMIVGNIISPKIKAAFYSKDTTGFKRTTHAFLLLSLLFALLYLRTTFWIFVAFIVPFAVLRTTLDTTWMEMLMVRSSPADRGLVMGVSDNMVHMGALLAPFLAGYVGETYGLRIFFLLCPVPLILGFLIASLRLMTSSTKTTKVTKEKKKN